MSETENTQVTSVETTAPATTETKPTVTNLLHKVFVGNLSFQTTEIQLSEFFSSVGNVILAKIITRGIRSLGYGFVAFETAEAAETAVAEMNKKELGGREINVEVAKLKSEVAKPKSEVAKPKSEVAPSEPRPRRNRFSGRRGGFRGRGRRPRNYPREPRRIDQEDNVDGERIDYNQTNEGEPPITSRKGGRGRRGGFRGGRRDSRYSGYRGGYRRFSYRRRSELSREPSGEPSKTTLFVANLPYSVNDEKLKEIFNEYKVTAAHVATRKISGYSKGFGFVEFESNEEQVRALETLNGLTVEGRELVLKVSMTEENGRKNSQEAAAAPPQEATEEATA
jgi:RNA recognition motif-containing protein